MDVDEAEPHTPARLTARLIVLDPTGWVLLFKVEDPSVAVPDDPREPLRHGIFWCTPGGGVEDDESYEDAALRELFEETGIRGVELGPCLLEDEKQLISDGTTLLFKRRHYLVRVTDRVVTLDGQTERERTVYRGHRWWSAEELDATEEVSFPERLAEIVRSVGEIVPMEKVAANQRH